MSSPSRWTVRILGAVSVDNVEVCVERFTTKRSAMLLIRLALSQGRAVYRDAICQALWPDEFFDVARPRLRQELKRLKDALGQAAEVIDTQRMSLRINTSIADIDLVLAEGLLARAQTETHTTRRNTIIAGFTPYALEIAPAYDAHWIESAREDWRSRASAGMMDLAAKSLEIGNVEEGLNLAKKACALHEFSEQTQAAYLEMLLKSGRRPEAQSHLIELEGRYREKLGAGPTLDLRNRVFARAASTCVDRIRVGAVSKSLPLPVSELVGRESIVKDVAAGLLPDSGARLWTLTGPGGIGKTAVAIAVGRDLFDAYKGRIWLVPLASIDSPRFLVNAIQNALGIPHTGADSFYAVARSLADEPSVLILDNLEQLVDGGAQIVRRLLEHCPALRLLVTSRRWLRIDGEHEFAVPPLSEEHAAELILRLAGRVNPFFSADAAEIAKLVDLLDRMPLAIYLAASRARHLSAAEMLTQLSKRFDLLVSSHGFLDPRHYGLRQTIAWSFEMLKPDVRQFLLDLSVFRGGWTLELAEEVVARPDMLSLLEELVANSFIFAMNSEEGMRFNMLHSIREFSEDKQEAPRQKEVLRSLSVSLLRFSTTASSRLLREDQMTWFKRLDVEYENIRRVLQYAAMEDPELGVTMCAKLWRFWTVKGYHLEASEWFHMLLPSDAPDVFALRFALFGAARCAMERGALNEAEAWFRRTLDHLERIGVPEWEYQTKLNLADVYFARSDFEAALKLLYETQSESGQNVNAYVHALIHDSLANNKIELGDYDGAQMHLDIALDELPRNEDRIALASAYITYGKLLMQTGPEEEAHKWLTEGCQIHADFGNRYCVGIAKQHLAELALKHGKLDHSEFYCGESARERAAVGDRLGMGHIARLFAEIWKQRGDSVKEARCREDARREFAYCGCEYLAEGDPRWGPRGR